jgi:Transposase IS116/IS110/IS902 family
MTVKQGRKFVNGLRIRRPNSGALRPWNAVLHQQPRVKRLLHPVAGRPLIFQNISPSAACLYQGKHVALSDDLEKMMCLFFGHGQIARSTTSLHDTHAKCNEDAQRAQQLSGIGPQIASALVATISNPQDFRNGRQLAAWAGLVPRQFSTGGKTVLGSITKRGDAYLRGLLTQSARSAMQSTLKRKPEKRSHLEHWIVTLHGRVGYHKTLVAIANKYLRILWAILARKGTLDLRGAPQAPQWQNLSAATAIYE